MATTLRSLDDRTDDAGRYQPLSLFSILALIVAVIFTVLVVTLTAVGLYTRKPVLELWLVLLACCGILGAGAAHWQISNSEGTLAGRGMAKVALWLSIIFGCVYVAYYAGNVIAIRNQARVFAQDVWLKAMTDRDFETSFLYTVDPSQRKGMTGRDAALRFGDVLSAFKHLEVIHLFDRAAGEVHIESQGMRDWSQQEQGFVVSLNFLVRTRAGEFDLVVTVIGTEGKEFSGRQWYVRAGAPFIQRKRLTTYGRLVVETQTDADKFLRDWVINKMINFRATEIYLDTQPLTPAQRQKKASEYMASGLMGFGFAAGSTPLGGLGDAAAIATHFGTMPGTRSVYLPGFDDMSRRLVRFDTTRQDQPKAAKDEVLNKLIRPSSISLGMGIAGAEVATQMEIKPNQIRVSLPVDLMLPAPLNYRCTGKLFAVCEDPALVARLNELGKAPWDGTKPIEPDTSAAVLAAYKHDWTIVEVLVDLARSKDDPRPGGGTSMPSAMPMNR